MAQTELVAYIKANISDFKSKMNEVKSQTEAMGKRMQDVGKSMSKYVTAPIVAMGTIAVMAYAKQEGAERKLAAAIRSTGGDVNKNMERFKTFASELQKITTVGDETALSMLQTATTMGLSADAAERATKNAIAMEAAFGVNAESAMRMTSALEQGDATMLKRYIPALRGVEDETLMVAKAHEILSNAFDVAKEDAQTFAGQMKQLKNSTGDLMEEFGKIIAKALTPLVAKLKELVSWFSSLDESTKKWIVGIAGVAAAVGPLLVTLGIFIKSILPALIAGGKAVAIAWAPLTAIIIGIYGAYRLFNIEAEKTAKIVDKLQGKTQVELEIRKDELERKLDEELKKIGLGGKLTLAMDAGGNVFADFINNVRKVFGVESEVEKTIRELGAVNETIKSRKKIEEESKKVNEEIHSLLNDNVETITKEESVLGRIGQLRQRISELESGKDMLGTPEELAAQNALIREAQEQLNEIVLAAKKLETIEMFGDAPQRIQALKAGLLDVKVVVETLPESFGQAFEEIKEKIVDVTQFIVSAFIEAMDFVGTAIGSAISGKEFATLDNMLMMFADWGKKLGAIMVAAGLAAAGFQKAIMTNPALAIGLGAALIAASAAVKATIASAPGTGVNTSYGSGTGSGAGRGDDLYGLRSLNQFAVNVTGETVVKGSDLHIVYSNENNRQSW